MWFWVSMFVGAAAVGILYALHREATRAVIHQAATLMFWQDAAEISSESRTSLDRKTFTQPRTFALLAAIVLSLAWGLIGNGSASEKTRFVVIDIGEEMRWRADPDQTLLNLAIKRATASPATIIVAGDVPRIIATSSDSTSTARGKLELLSATEVPPVASNAGASLMVAAHLSDSLSARDDSLPIDWYTPRSTVPDDVPPSVRIRVRVHQQVSPDGRASIESVAFDDDGSSHGRLSLRVGRTSASFTRPLTIRFTSAGTSTLDPVHFSPGEFDTDVVLQNIAANGADATIVLDDGNNACQTIPLRLPSWPPIKVVAVSNAPAALMAMATITHVSDDGADHPIEILNEDVQASPTATGVIRVIRNGPSAADRELLVAAPNQSIVAGLDFESAFAGSGPSVHTDHAVPLIRAGNATLASYDAGGETLYISSALVEGQAEFPQRAAFPVFLTRAIRALAGRTELPLVAEGARVIADPLWPNATARPIAVGELSHENLAIEQATVPDAPGHFPISTLAVLIAGALLAIEGVLLAVGKVR